MIKIFFGKIKLFFGWLKWKIDGEPMKNYLGYHCTICGKWRSEPFKVPTYKSDGRWWDTWKVCDQCIKEAEEKKDKEDEPVQGD
jgi:hypothetical protein